VLLCGGRDEANRAIEEMLVRGTFGTAGARIVIQEYLEGTEVSLHALCDGKTAKLFPTSQDHKRALDGDQGLNTGGMGAYSPAPFLTGADLQQINRLILEPWLRGCAAEGIDFHGILYPGLILTKAGPKVLEFNTRFGDPETQVYLTRMQNDLVELLQASIDGSLAATELRWDPFVSVCVVMASAGYPGSYTKGKVIEGLNVVAKLPNVKLFHAGTASLNGRIVTTGGRVLGVTAWAADLKGARLAAYSAVDQIWFEGAHFRRDIGCRGL
jgi:phosphoribosylamine--glycine ligase